MLSAMGVSTQGGKPELLSRLNARLGVVVNGGGAQRPAPPVGRTAMASGDPDPPESAAADLHEVQQRKGPDKGPTQDDDFVRDGRQYIPTEGNGLMPP
eukprot:SAG22_NODE_9818_length_568_cov_0.703625_1_plen_97_part_01